MKEMKGYLAYQAIAGGLLLRLVARENWMLRLVAFALIAAGALALQRVSRWFFGASIAADAAMAFALVCGPAALPPGLLRVALEYLSLVPLLLVGCLLLRGYGAQMRRGGRGEGAEWALLALWSVGCILPMLLGLGLLAAPLLPAGTGVANTLLPVGHIALIVETFRAQKEYLRMEEENT